MSKHNSNHGGNRSPAEIMMHSGGGRHYAEGGAAVSRAMPLNTTSFKEGGMAGLRKGGRPKPFMRNGRACHAEGDSVSATNPVTGHKYGDGPTSYSESVTDTKLRKGGRARHKRKRHAEGDSASDDAVPYSRGGRAQRRAHHDFGDLVRTIGNGVKGLGSAALNVAPYLLPLLLKRGGRAEGGEAKLAEGGAGKVRKGMMTEKGRMISNT